MGLKGWGSQALAKVSQRLLHHDEVRILSLGWVFKTLTSSDAGLWRSVQFVGGGVGYFAVGTSADGFMSIRAPSKLPPS